MSGVRASIRRRLAQGSLAALVGIASAGFAQQPASPSGDESSLTETQVQTLPLAPATPPLSAATTPPLPTQATTPVTEHATLKQQRQAEKFYLIGAKAIEQNDSRAAYEAFGRAASADPANQQYAAAREIARQHLVTLLIQEAEKARLVGHSELSRQKLQEAYTLDPKNPLVTQHVEELADEHRIAIDPKDSVGADAAGPIELTPASTKKSFHLKGTQQDILKQVLTAYQVTPVMDSSVTQKQIRIDADDVSYAEASQMVKMLTGTFFVPLDPKRVLVARDDKEDRLKYDRLLVESIYLPGLNTTELTDISNVAKNVFEAPVATLDPGRNTLTVRATEPRMKALNATLEELLDGRSQLVLQVRLFDVSHTRTTNIGVQLPQQTTVFNVDSELNSLIQGNQAAIDQIISSGLAAPGDYGAILAILIASGQITSSLLTQGFLTVGGGLTQFGYNLGTATGNLSLNSSDARALDEIHLRVQDQETATFKVGTRYPIVTSTYSSGGSSLNVPGISSAGLSSTLSGLGVNLSSLTSQVTIPQIQYQDLGLTLKATPRVQHGAEVALNMELELTALGGSTLDGNPILNNRKYTATITLKDGSTALVVSTLSKQETRAVSGLPGLDELPGLRSATNDSKDLVVSTLVVLVTPHIVRRTHVNVAGQEIVLPRHD